MAGRKASTLCSPATLSQCARVSPESRLPCRAPPSGATRPDALRRHLECGRGRVSGPFTATAALLLTEQVPQFDSRLRRR